MQNGEAGENKTAYRVFEKVWKTTTGLVLSLSRSILEETELILQNCNNYTINKYYCERKYITCIYSVAQVLYKVENFITKFLVTYKDSTRPVKKDDIYGDGLKDK